jgi:transcriptional regulator with XRE-family HTH domain
LDGVGSRVRALRKTRRLTLRELADHAGLYHTTISELERGVTDPSLDTLQRIADALQVSISVFVDPKTEP